MAPIPRHRCSSCRRGSALTVFPNCLTGLQTMPEIPPRDPFHSDPVGDAARGEESVRATLPADGPATPGAAAMDRAIGHAAITEAVYICEAATLTDGGK